MIDHGRLEVPGVIHGGIQTRMIGILGLKAVAIRLGFLRFSFEAIDTSGDITPVCILYKVKYFFWPAECWTVMLIGCWAGHVFDCQEFHAAWSGDFASHGLKCMHAAATWQRTNSIASDAETNLANTQMVGSPLAWGVDVISRCIIF